jgi:hypothetical protein
MVTKKRKEKEGNRLEATFPLFKFLKRVSNILFLKS